MEVGSRAGQKSLGWKGSDTEHKWGHSIAFAWDLQKNHAFFVLQLGGDCELCWGGGG